MLPVSEMPKWLRLWLLSFRFLNDFGSAKWTKIITVGIHRNLCDAIFIACCVLFQFIRHYLFFFFDHFFDQIDLMDLEFTVRSLLRHDYAVRVEIVKLMSTYACSKCSGNWVPTATRRRDQAIKKFWVTLPTCNPGIYSLDVTTIQQNWRNCVIHWWTHYINNLRNFKKKFTWWVIWLTRSRSI